jgi:m7GpppX diphosphatase
VRSPNNHLVVPTDYLSFSDQNGRRISLLGTVDGSPALLTAERAAFPTDPGAITAFHDAIGSVANLGANDIYHWYLASSRPVNGAPPDLKLNLICPCTEQHIKKYSQQGVRMVTETPEIYKDRVRPFMQLKREQGRLNWVWNIIEGRTEQEDVILRDHGGSGPDGEGFLMLPDLNWDRKTISSLHLLAIVERRDIWSLRDLKKEHIVWLKHMRTKLIDATVQLYPELEPDQLKLYIHC